MNKIIYGAVGFLIGAVSGAFGARIYLKNRYEALADKEIDEVKKMYLEKEIELESKISEEKPKKKKASTKKKETKSEKTEEKPKRVKQKINYNDISRKEEEVKAENEAPEEEEPAEPYEITFQEFDDEHPEYDKINLSYYDEDGSLVTDDEEIVDADDTIGVENLDKFVSDEMNEMYVRNNAISTDYDIALVYGNYVKMMGI